MSEANTRVEGAEDPRFTIILPRSVWLAVARILGRAPYDEVAGILDAMSVQVVPQYRAHQAAAQSQPSAPSAPTEPSPPSTTH